MDFVKRAIRLIQPPGPRLYYMALDPQPPGPGPQLLLAFMKFQQQSMLPGLLSHCFCEDSSMVEKFNSVSPTLSHFLISEPLMRKTELRARETFVNKIIRSLNP